MVGAASDAMDFVDDDVVELPRAELAVVVTSRQGLDGAEEAVGIDIGVAATVEAVARISVSQDAPEAFERRLGDALAMDDEEHAARLRGALFDVESGEVGLAGAGRGYDEGARLALRALVGEVGKGGALHVVGLDYAVCCGTFRRRYDSLGLVGSVGNLVVRDEIGCEGHAAGRIPDLLIDAVEGIDHIAVRSGADRKVPFHIGLQRPLCNVGAADNQVDGPAMAEGIALRMEPALFVLRVVIDADVDIGVEEKGPQGLRVGETEIGARDETSVDPAARHQVEGQQELVEAALVDEGDGHVERVARAELLELLDQGVEDARAGLCVVVDNGGAEALAGLVAAIDEAGGDGGDEAVPCRFVHPGRLDDVQAIDAVAGALEVG